MQRLNATRLWLLSLSLVLLLQACAVRSIPSSPARVPPLPATARQEPTLSFCLPTCSGNLSSEMKRWQARLTGQESPETSAQQITTR